MSEFVDVELDDDLTDKIQITQGDESKKRISNIVKAQSV